MSAPIPAEILNDRMARAVFGTFPTNRRVPLIAPTSTEWADDMESARWFDAYAVGNFGQRDRCHHFCSEQRSQHARGYRVVEISTCIFGYVVRDTMNDGEGTLFGGRQRKGTTQAETLAWARAWHAERPTHREVIAGYGYVADDMVHA